MSQDAPNVSILVDFFVSRRIPIDFFFRRSPTYFLYPRGEIGLKGAQRRKRKSMYLQNYLIPSCFVEQVKVFIFPKKSDLPVSSTSVQCPHCSSRMGRKEWKTAVPYKNSFFFSRRWLSPLLLRMKIFGAERRQAGRVHHIALLWQWQASERKVTHDVFVWALNGNNIPKNQLLLLTTAGNAAG